jgi:2,3-bisphosphoglycerate-dependent phosphoglycerate mutase
MKFRDDNSNELDVLFCQRRFTIENEAMSGGVWMGQIVLLRHGESQWNLENRFTGWVDVPLSPKGEEEARSAGLKLKSYRFDRAFTSVLIRANETLRIVLEAIGQTTIPIEKDQALNERMYGDLQGLNKAETAKQYGEQQVKIWRRSYDVRPPNGESLKDTAERVLPYYERRINPHVLAGETILIAAHGNSLRALVMHLDQLSKEEVLELNIPTGAPLVYRIGEGGKVLDHRYL